MPSVPNPWEAVQVPSVPGLSAHLKGCSDGIGQALELPYDSSTTAAERGQWSLFTKGPSSRRLRNTASALRVPGSPVPLLSDVWAPCSRPLESQASSEQKTRDTNTRACLPRMSWKLALRTFLRLVDTGAHPSSGEGVLCQEQASPQTLEGDYRSGPALGNWADLAILYF